MARAAPIASVVFSLGLAACGASPAEPRSPGQARIEVVEASPQSNPVVVALPAHTLWRGRYVCPQGPTALTLTLDLQGDGRATAVFDFGPLPENPTVPTGRYLVVGQALSPGDGSVDLALAPDRWIAQPTGYDMVGLVAHVEPAGRALRGRVDHPSCTGVELWRVQ